MATLHFRNAHIYLSPSASGVAVPITESRSFDLSVDGPDLDEDNAFGDTWKTALPGLVGWSVSVESNWDTAQVTVFDASTQIVGPVRWYGYPDRASASRFYSGMTWVKFSSSGSTSSVGRVNIDLTGDGALTAA